VIIGTIVTLVLVLVLLVMGVIPESLQEPVAVLLSGVGMVLMIAIGAMMLRRWV
jgi:hypothetical protein